MGFTDHPQDLRGFSAEECTRFQQEYRQLFHNRFPQHLRTHSGAFKQTEPKENGRKRGEGGGLWKSGRCELYAPWNSGGGGTFARYAQEVLHVEQCSAVFAAFAVSAGVHGSFVAGGSGESCMVLGYLRIRRPLIRLRHLLPPLCGGGRRRMFVVLGFEPTARAGHGSCPARALFLRPSPFAPFALQASSRPPTGRTRLALSRPSGGCRC